MKIVDYFISFKSKKGSEYIIPAIIIAGIVLILEVFVFNFRYWQFIGNNSQIAVSDYTLSENITRLDTNTFVVNNTETKPYIEIAGLDMPVNLVYFDFVNVDRGDYGVLDFKYTLELTDEGNALPYKTPERSFFRLSQKTHYTTLNPYGNLHSMRVYFDNLNAEDVVRINSFILNPRYERMLSKKRMAFLFCILYILWIIRPNTRMYSYSVCDKFAWKKLVVVCLLLVEIFTFYKTTRLNKYFDNVPDGGQTQFMQLAEAIVDRGEVFLAAIPPEGLAEMADPYDAMLRNSTVGEDSDIGDMSDTGYYKGRYFVYFGIAPILLFYVPFYAITGTHIATRTVFFILSVFNCIGVSFLLYQICRRWFQRMPFITYLMFSVLFSFGAGQLYLALSPDFYAVPIIFALSSILVGLGLWLKALNDCDEKVVHGGNNSFSMLLLMIGSLFMALTAASRPQFLIASFIVVILFWKSVFIERILFSKSSIKQTVAFVTPYVIVACGMMYYNYIRFGNPFDLGANYNFCYNNMPYRGWHIDRLLHPLVGYLFYPCTVTNEFPFFEYSAYTSRYMGITADETLLGGVIYNNIYLIIALFAFRFKRLITDKTAYAVAVIAPIFAIIVGVVDANMAGTLPRYYADFTWGYMISAFIVLGYILTVGEWGYFKADGLSRIVNVLFYIAFIWTLVRFFLMPFAGDKLYNTNLYVYYTIKNLVEFWY